MKYFFLIFFLLIFTFFFYKGLQKDPTIIPSNLIEKQIPNFKLKKTKFFSFFDKSNLLEHREPKIINFFASWCPPCKIEHEQLINLSKKHDVFGIAKKDTMENVKLWLQDRGNPYNKIGFDFDGLASIEWGVYGLPETFIVNKSGEIIYRHVGPITSDNINKIQSIIKSSL